MVSEDELVRAIRKVLSGDAPGVVLGAGDDAAVVDIGGRHTLVTVDTLVQGVHWDPDITLGHDLGHKAVTVNVSDVAAMGGSPRFGVVSLAVPRDVSPAWVMELYGGMRQAADEYGLALVGGDTVRAPGVVISVTVLGGVPEGGAVTRGGAGPGDRIVVTGSLGAAAGGVRLAGAEEGRLRRALGTDWERSLMSALTHPAARVGEGAALARAGATAMIDLSDGLALDLSRVCEMSEVGADVRVADVPIAPPLHEAAGILDVDPLDLALHGGEDYELLATLPEEAVGEARGTLADRYGTPLTEIGEITGSGLRALRPDGTAVPLEPKGWDHLS